MFVLLLELRIRVLPHLTRGIKYFQLLRCDCKYPGSPNSESEKNPCHIYVMFSSNALPVQTQTVYHLAVMFHVDRKHKLYSCTLAVTACHVVITVQGT